MYVEEGASSKPDGVNRHDHSVVIRGRRDFLDHRVYAPAFPRNQFSKRITGTPTLTPPAHHSYQTTEKETLLDAKGREKGDWAATSALGTPQQSNYEVKHALVMLRTDHNSPIMVVLVKTCKDFNAIMCLAMGIKRSYAKGNHVGWLFLLWKNYIHWFNCVMPRLQVCHKG